MKVVKQKEQPLAVLRRIQGGGVLPAALRATWQTLRQSRRAGRIQQLVRGTAEAAGIGKRVYPHLLRHTVAQHLADRGMPEELLQQFLGHEYPQTTQVYYTPKRSRVKRSFEEAMAGGAEDGK